MNSNSADRIPTLDLHVHLRGTMLPTTAALFSRRNEVPLPPDRLDAQFGYVFSGFDDFLACYDEVGRVIRTGNDLRELTSGYLRRVAKQGTMYVEFMISPDHSIENGIPYVEQIAAIESGIVEARSSADIAASIIITCVRHRGPEAAMNLAQLVVAHPHPLIVGFGMTGDENSYEARDFAGAFSIAKRSGLRLTAHAGEWRSAETVVEAVEALGLDRVGHGISVVQSHGALTHLAGRNTGYEVCVSSNFLLNAVASGSVHPLAEMLSKGCRVTLATDDPAFFQTTPAVEMEIASDKLGLSRSDLISTVRHGIEMSFAPAATKLAMRRKLDAAQSGG